MNRLLGLPHQTAIVRAVQQSAANPTAYLHNNPALSALGSLLPGAWLSTAVAPQRNDAASNDTPQHAAESQPSGASTHITHNTALPASRGVTSSSAAGPSDLPSSTSPSAASPQTLNLAAVPLPVDQEDAGDDAQVDGPAALSARPRSQLLQVVPTPEGPPQDKLLMRDFIQNSLYHPTLGYFNAPTPPVGSMGSPVNYWRIYCRDEFNILVKKKYEELETSFLTPAELFSPWYGACIARHIVEHRKHHLGIEGQPLLIVEVGGGNGTLARDVLDWLRDNRPADYALTSYTCLEISSSLAARQYDKVVREGGHGGHFHLRRGSGLDPSVWGAERVWDHTFVLMMEVLDNLPHDRVFRHRPGDPWQQTVICPATTSTHPSPSNMELGPWQEAAEPATEPLLCRTLAAVYRPPTREQQLDERFNRVLDFILARDTQPTSRDEVLWLPTAAAAFLELLHDRRPNHSLIAADFDKLPDVRLPGRNAPLVAQKVAGRNIDHDTVLIPWGTADIFFPTDFEALCNLYRATARHVWGRGGAGSQGRAGAPGGGGAGGGDGAAAGEGGGAVHAASSNNGMEAGAQAAAVEGEAEDVALGDVNAEHFRQGAVMKRYREMFNTATICAFNPMVDDFVNARFFFGDSKNRYPPGQSRPVQVQSKTRLPQAPSSLASGIKSHIPAAPASKVKSRYSVPAPPPPEPVLGGRRQRTQPEGGKSGGIGGGVGGGKGQRR